MDRKKVGVIAILAASLMWALEPIFAKLASTNFNAIQISTLRALIIASLAIIFILITGKGKSLKLDKTQFSVTVYIALIATVFSDLLYFYAITKIPVMNAVLIGHMQPIFMAMIAFFILKSDKLSRADLLGIFLIIFAGILVSVQTFDNLFSFNFGSAGNLIALCATIGWSTTGLAARKYLGKVNTTAIIFYRFIIAGIVFSTYLILTSSLKFFNFYILILGLVSAIGTLFFYEGIKRIKVTQVSAFELFSTFFAAVLGFFILGEAVTLLQAGGIIFLFVGVYFISKK